MPSFDRVCHNIYISPSKGGFPCCNSTRYQWWSESLYLKLWAILLHYECTTHFVKVTQYCDIHNNLSLSPWKVTRQFLLSRHTQRSLCFCALDWFGFVPKVGITKIMPCLCWEVFDAANSDLRCERPQWELNQNCLFTSHSFDPFRSLADLSTSSTF